ncbi:unnamed protein product [Urochloa humidicola]
MDRRCGPPNRPGAAHLRPPFLPILPRSLRRRLHCSTPSTIAIYARPNPTPSAYKRDLAAAAASSSVLRDPDTRQRRPHPRCALRPPPPPPVPVSDPPPRRAACAWRRRREGDAAGLWLVRRLQRKQMHRPAPRPPSPMVMRSCCLRLCVRP